MKDLTLEMLEAGQQLKAALSHAHRLFGLKDTKGLIDAWLKANDPGISYVSDILTEEEMKAVEEEVAMQDAKNDIYMSEEML